MAKKSKSSSKQIKQAKKEVEQTFRDAEKAVGRRASLKRIAPLAVAGIAMAAGAVAVNRFGSQLQGNRLLRLLFSQQLLGFVLSLTPLRRYRFLLPIALTVGSMISGQRPAARRRPAQYA